MNRILTYYIEETHSNLTIDKFLRSKGYSRQNITDLKKMNESIVLNDKWVHINKILNTGDKLIIHIQENNSSMRIPPVNIPIDIIYEDEDIIVVNKPAGMPVHPSIDNYTNSLGNALAYYYENQGKPFIFRCTNRLDKDTSGLTVVAKNMLSASLMSAAIREHNLTREYNAIVCGHPTPSNGTINAPIARKDASIIEREVNFETGDNAITHYNVVSSYNDYSLVHIILETGRTHQIRVHMKYIGCPLVGDRLYNTKLSNDNTFNIEETHSTYTIKRQALHCQRLSFKHPITGKDLVFEAPLPDDMRFLLENQ